MNVKRQYLFKIIALLMPFLVLLGLEGALRLFGYGHDLRVFTEDPARKGFVVLNKHAAEKYFSNQKNATTGNFEPFASKKAPNTFRVFVLGESTTIGYPYMNNGSFHRWLHYRLMHTYPDRDFEIINLSLTAVNSYTVLDFAKSALKYEPDAMLVYTGHNEYYGAMGVAATRGIGHNRTWARLLMALREFRVTQLMAQCANKVSEGLTGEKLDLRENLMKRMASGEGIAFGSDAYQAGLHQFEKNITELANEMSNNNIPLLISNVVSNEKDLKPLMPDPAGKALAHYSSGQEHYKRGRFAEAKEEFVKAKELDLLRFRAPEAMNDMIRKIATQNKGVKLVDCKSIFEQHSAHHIIGQETLLEHVHPNLFGYALLSEAFYQGMKQAGLLPAIKDEISLSDLQNRMPITRVDSLKGAFEVMILKEGWPFNIPMPAEENRPKTEEEKLAGALVVKQISWREAMARLQQHYAARHDTAGALRVSEALALDNPLDAAAFDQAAKLSASLQQNQNAIVYFSKAFRLEKNFDRAKALFVLYLKMDKPEAALPYIAEAAAVNTSAFSLNELHRFVTQLTELKKRYATDSSNVLLSNQIAKSYLQFANAAAAEKYIKKSVQIDPRNGEALTLFKQAKLVKK